MRNLWKHLSSPRHLVVFEAAARLGSFTKASSELNVQQPAVSASIRQLEESLGAKLFVRSHRKVDLTTAGERLMADVTRAFEQLAQSAAAIQQLSRPDYVTLSASTAFNNYWIMPRLADLQAKHPGIDLRLQSSDREPDIDSENITLAVRRGDGNWSGYNSALIAEEVIYPIASPMTMAAAKGLRNISGLLHQRLIHLEEPVRERPGWSEWLAHFGIEGIVPRGGLRLNDYALVIQAAMAGEGFAFGWKHLADGLVEQGLLSGRTEWEWRSGQGFYLVWSAKQPLSKEGQMVKDWILSQTD